MLPDPEPLLPRHVERHRPAAHPAGDALAKPPFQHRPPGNEGELPPSLDDRDLAAREPERPLVDALDALAVAGLDESEAGFLGDPLAGGRRIGRYPAKPLATQTRSCLSMKVRSPMPCSCSCLSPTRSQRRRRELHGADSDMAQRPETAMAHTLRLGSLAELHG